MMSPKHCVERLGERQTQGKVIRREISAHCTQKKGDKKQSTHEAAECVLNSTPAGLTPQERAHRAIYSVLRSARASPETSHGTLCEV